MTPFSSTIFAPERNLLTPQPVTEASATRFRASRGAILCALLLGLATTIYIELTGFFGLALRPAHIIPWFFGILTLPFARIAIRAGETKFSLFPILYVAYIGLRHAPAGPEGLIYFIKAVGNIIAYWSMLSILARTKNSYAGYLGLIAGCLASFFFAASGLSAFGVDSRMGSGRWQGFMPGANRFANISLIATVATLAAVFLPCKRSRWSWVQLLLWLICAAAIVTSGSRAVFAIAAIGHGLVYLLYVYVGRKSLVNTKLLLALTISCCVVAAGVALCSDYIPQRLIDFVNSRNSPYATIEEDSRRELYDIAIDYFRESPLFGVGMEAERFEIQTETGESMESSSHSTYLHLLSVSGVVGFVLFMALPTSLLTSLVSALVVLRRDSRCGMRREVVAAVSVLLIFGLHATVISLCNAMHTWIVLGTGAHTAIQWHRLSYQSDRAAPGEKRVIKNVARGAQKSVKRQRPSGVAKHVE
jgi:O-antigen ligase